MTVNLFAFSDGWPALPRFFSISASAINLAVSYYSPGPANAKAKLLENGEVHRPKPLSAITNLNDLSTSFNKTRIGGEADLPDLKPSDPLIKAAVSVGYADNLTDDDAKRKRDVDLRQDARKFHQLTHERRGKIANKVTDFANYSLAAVWTGFTYHNTCASSGSLACSLGTIALTSAAGKAALDSLYGVWSAIADNSVEEHLRDLYLKLQKDALERDDKSQDSVDLMVTAIEKTRPKVFENSAIGKGVMYVVRGMPEKIVGRFSLKYDTNYFRKRVGSIDHPKQA